MFFCQTASKNSIGVGGLKAHHRPGRQRDIPSNPIFQAGCLALPFMGKYKYTRCTKLFLLNSLLKKRETSGCLAMIDSLVLDTEKTSEPADNNDESSKNEAQIDSRNVRKGELHVSFASRFPISSPQNSSIS